MSIITKKALPRRTFLRGLGVDGAATAGRNGAGVRGDAAGRTSYVGRIFRSGSGWCT
jgi:hypothetical protein